ncbi:hypothetical protein [Methylovirgula sp. 4M-Z18]|uniref:hypothetical protein n=1 Tax=Methylovirgula sp. 4M-Z18 TaxID=2293567 RepID=UPI000E2E6AF7|nr:hypothetical protein [Methylovirgula sp. 4M-Z18]
MSVPPDQKSPEPADADKPEHKSLIEKVVDVFTHHHEKVLEEEKKYLDARWSDATERDLADELIKHGDGFSEHDDPSSKA